MAGGCCDTCRAAGCTGEASLGLCKCDDSCTCPGGNCQCCPTAQNDGFRGGPNFGGGGVGGGGTINKKETKGGCCGSGGGGSTGGCGGGPKKGGCCG